MKECGSKLTEILDKHKKELNEKSKTVIKFKIITKAKATKFSGLMDDGTVKLSVKEVPENGKANKEIITFLSKEFGVGKNNISIILGSSSKLKLISIKKENV